MNAGNANGARAVDVGADAVFDAIVLAGGRGSRLGGVDKAAVELGEQRLVDRAVGAAREAGAARVIVAGPPHTGTFADAVVREDPPFSGPLSALGAAIDVARAPWVMLLACDLVHPDAIVARLREAVCESVHETERAVASARADGAEAAGAAARDGAILLDESGHPQWLAACARTAPLRARLAALRDEPGGTDGRPLRAAFETLALQRIRARAGSTDDIDTPEQLARARAAATREKEAGE